jgi:hypothetical protein
MFDFELVETMHQSEYLFIFIILPVVLYGCEI